MSDHAHHKAVRVTIDGRRYPSFRAAAQALGDITGYGVRWRCEHLDWPGWRADGVEKWRDGGSKGFKARACLHVARYGRVGDAAREHGVAVSTVWKWCEAECNGWRFDGDRR